MRLATAGLYTIALLVLAPLASAPLAAQTPGSSVGFTAGLGLSTLTGDDVAGDLSRRVGLSIGGFADIQVGGIVGVVPGVYYVQKGTAPSGPSIDRIAIDYVEIPLLIRVAVRPPDPMGFNFLLGPTFGIQVRCEAVTPQSTVACEDDAPLDLDLSRTFDLGAAFGAGVSFSISPGIVALVTAMWDIGLTSLDRSPAARTVRNDAILLSLGMAWLLGR